MEHSEQHLNDTQRYILYVLQEVTRVLEELNIPYFMQGGTMLGAIRHGGFIPWDDDIDIVMMRKDAKRLEKILHKMDSEKYVYQSMKSDVEYVNAFGKFRKREGRITTSNRRYNYYKWAGIGFDIFAIEKTSYFAARTATIIYNNVQHLTSYIRCSWVRRPLIRLVQALCFGLFNPILRLVGKINPRQEYHYALGTGWARHTFFMKDTLPLAKAQFEGEEFPVPKDMDAYLTNVYGDWRKLPNDEQIRKCIHCKEYIEEIYGKSNKQ